MCDVCGKAGAKRWTIVRRDNRVQRTGDLCGDCEAKLQPFLDAFGKVHKGRPQAQREILTPAQIKARSRARAKAS